MHCSLRNRKTGQVEEEVTPKLSRQLEGTWQQEGEQTGLTAGPGSVGAALNVLNHKTERVEGGEGGQDGEGGRGGGVGESLHITDTENSPLL